MVDHLDVEEFSGLDKAFRHGDIFRAGLRVSGRVVVDHGNGRAGPADGLCKHFGGADDCRVDASHVEVMDELDLILGVQQHDAQVLALQARHFRHQHVRDVARTRDGYLIIVPERCDALSQFNCGQQLAGFGV